MFKRVGFCGYVGAGKDTAAQALIARGYIKYSFGDAVKEAIRILNPYVPHQDTYFRVQELLKNLGGWDAVKQLPEARRLLQVGGTEVGREFLSASIWVDVLKTRITTDAPALITITDIRFPNEIDILGDDGLLIWVDNPKRKSDGHASENPEMRKRAHAIVRNTGTIEHLHVQVLSAVGLTR